QAAGSDIAAQLPALKGDLATTVDLAENQIPQLHGVISDLTTRVVAVENKVVPAATTDVAAVTGIVRSVLSGLAPVPVVTPPTNVGATPGSVAAGQASSVIDGA